MIRSVLLGAAAGMRAMTPLATVTAAARRRELPESNGLPRLLDTPLAAAGAMALAVGELAGDKMPTAPDRIIPAGMVGRVATGAIAAAAVAPRRRRAVAAGLGAATAFAASYLTWGLRMRAMRRFGQTRTGFVEDAAALGLATLAVRGRRAA